MGRGGRDKIQTAKPAGSLKTKDVLFKNHNLNSSNPEKDKNLNSLFLNTSRGDCRISEAETREQLIKESHGKAILPETNAEFNNWGDFSEAVGYSYDIDYPCEKDKDYTCHDEGICRCGKVKAFKITKIRSSEIAEKFLNSLSSQLGKQKTAYKKYLKDFGASGSKDPDHLIGFAENHRKSITKEPMYQLKVRSGNPDLPDPRIYDFKLQKQISKICNSKKAKRELDKLISKMNTTGKLKWEGNVEEGYYGQEIHGAKIKNFSEVAAEVEKFIYKFK